MNDLSEVNSRHTLLLKSFEELVEVVLLRGAICNTAVRSSLTYEKIWSEKSAHLSEYSRLFALL